MKSFKDTLSVVWLFWLGGPLSPQRAKSLRQWKNTGLQIQLIRLENVESLAARAGFKMHPAFKYLSANHKSDYLRSHLMARLGGFYSDVKPPPRYIRFHLQRFSNSSKLCAGHRELDISGISLFSPTEVRESWAKLAGNTHFAFKPGTDFANEWVSRVEKKMNEHAERLEKWGVVDPGRGPTDDEPLFRDYPIRWAELQGELFHQLQYDFDFPISLTLPRPSSRPYR